MFFGVFLGFEHLFSLKPGEPCKKCCKQQLKGSRKLTQSAQGSVLAPVYTKSAEILPENTKSGKRAKRIPKNSSVHVCKSMKNRCTVVLRAELTYRALIISFIADSGSLRLILCDKLAF